MLNVASMLPVGPAHTPPEKTIRFFRLSVSLLIILLCVCASVSLLELAGLGLLYNGQVLGSDARILAADRQLAALAEQPLYPIDPRQRRARLLKTHQDLVAARAERTAAASAFTANLHGKLELQLGLLLGLSVLTLMRLRDEARALAAALIAVAAGQQDVELPATGRDEFALVARAFNGVARRLADRPTASEPADRLTEQLLDVAPVGLMVLEPLRDASGAFVDFVWRFANPSAERLFVRHAGELIGQRVGALMPGFRTTGLCERLVSVVDTAKPVRLVLLYDHEKVSKRLAVDAVLLHDSVVMCVVDVSARQSRSA